MFYETLACIGLNFILKYGSILDLPRRALVSRFKFFRDLFDCSLCLGFWCGVTGSASLYYIHGEWNYIYYFLPFVAALGSLTADVVIGTVKTYEMRLEHGYGSAPASFPPVADRAPCPGCGGEAEDPSDKEGE